MKIQQIQRELEHAHAWIEDTTGIHLINQSKQIIFSAAELLTNATSSVIYNDQRTVTAAKVATCALSVFVSPSFFLLSLLAGFSSNICSPELNIKLRDLEHRVTELFHSAGCKSGILCTIPSNATQIRDKSVKLLASAGLLATSYLFLPSPIPLVMSSTAGLLIGKSSGDAFFRLRQQRQIKITQAVRIQQTFRKKLHKNKPSPHNPESRIQQSVSTYDVVWNKGAKKYQWTKKLPQDGIL